MLNLLSKANPPPPPPPASPLAFITTPTPQKSEKLEIGKPINQ